MSRLLRKCYFIYSTYRRTRNTRHLIIFVLCFLSALGLKCYRCSNLRSWAECLTSMTSHTCPSGYDRCAKVYFKNLGVEYFQKYCIPEAECTTKANPTCKSATGSFECVINCCDGDNCNAGSAFRISGMLLLTCALVSLVMLVKA